MQIRSDFRHRISLQTVRGINQASPTEENRKRSDGVFKKCFNGVLDLFKPSRFADGCSEPPGARGNGSRGPGAIRRHRPRLGRSEAYHPGSRFLHFCISLSFQ